jgi:hypothetical protein
LLSTTCRVHASITHVTQAFLPALLRLPPNLNTQPTQHSKRYFSVKQAYEEGLVDKLVPGYKLNRFRKIAADAQAGQAGYYASDKPKFRFTRQAGGDQA